MCVTKLGSDTHTTDFVPIYETSRKEVIKLNQIIILDWYLDNSCKINSTVSI